MGLKEKPAGIPERQATAAVGQTSLCRLYEKAFNRHERQVAQVLLTPDGILSSKAPIFNARNTLNVLLGWVFSLLSTRTTRLWWMNSKFGDNDNLAGMITHLMDAQVLVNLTDIDGLFDKDPRIHEDAALLPLVSKIDRSLERASRHVPGAVGLGM